MKIDSHMHLSKEGVSKSLDSSLIAHIEKTLASMNELSIRMGILAHGLPVATLDQVVAKYGSRFKGLLYVVGHRLNEGLEAIDRYGDNPEWR